MPSDGITRKNTVEQYLKAKTDLRISPESVEAGVTAINQLADLLVSRAVDLAKDDKRTTLLDRDVTTALQALAAPGGNDPAGVFAQVDRLTTDQLAQLINLVQEWLKAKK